MMVHKAEGDVNNSDQRGLWQELHLSRAAQASIQEDQQFFLHQALSTPCLNTVKAVDGIFLIDEDGRRIMDFHGNSVHQLGYNHPALLDALKKQLESLSFSPRRYANETATACAKKLCQLMPSDDYKVLFTTSGAASNETALKLVRRATGKYKVLAAQDSFHGATLYTISVGGTAHFRDGLGPLAEGCLHYPHYSSYQGEDPNGEAALAYLEEQCKTGEIGAIMAEPVRCTDVQIPPISYWKKIRELCDRYDISLIFDEIPTAFGRTGTMFAFESFGVTPDILTLGKGLGGGLIPFSAVIAHKKFDVCHDTSMGHFTHEKNPLGSAVALALIEEIQSQNLLVRAVEIGARMKKWALELKEKNALIGDVRQIGALVAIELVKDHRTKEKAEQEAERVLYDCLSLGLSFKISQGNVITLAPPLIITDEELGNAMDILESALLCQTVLLNP